MPSALSFSSRVSSWFLSLPDLEKCKHCGACWDASCFKDCRCVHTWSFEVLGMELWGFMHIRRAFWATSLAFCFAVLHCLGYVNVHSLTNWPANMECFREAEQSESENKRDERNKGPWDMEPWAKDCLRLLMERGGVDSVAPNGAWPTALAALTSRPWDSQFGFMWQALGLMAEIRSLTYSPPLEILWWGADVGIFTVSSCTCFPWSLGQLTV